METVPARDGQGRSQTESNLRERETTGQWNTQLRDKCLFLLSSDWHLEHELCEPISTAHRCCPADSDVAKMIQRWYKSQSEHQA
jgi:hypothetical protein